MKISRIFATSATIATFFITALSGFILLFHLSGGMEEAFEIIHEIMGAAMIMACILHIVVNYTSFKKYFYGMRLVFILVVCALSIIVLFALRDFTQPQDRLLAKVLDSPLNATMKLINANETAFNAFLSKHNIYLNDTDSINSLIKRSGLEEDEILESLLYKNP